jgi:hypothetical protein
MGQIPTASMQFVPGLGGHGPGSPPLSSATVASHMVQSQHPMIPCYFREARDAKAPLSSQANMDLGLSLRDEGVVVML